jgi:hypothetical protein
VCQIIVAIFTGLLFGCFHLFLQRMRCPKRCDEASWVTRARTSILANILAETWKAPGHSLHQTGGWIKTTQRGESATNSTLISTSDHSNPARTRASKPST